MNQNLCLGRRGNRNEAMVFQIFKYSEELPLTIYWPVSRSLGHSSHNREIVQGSRERQWKASLMVSEIGPKVQDGRAESSVANGQKEVPNGILV
jgi:hypothetical protein